MTLVFLSLLEAWMQLNNFIDPAVKCLAIGVELLGPDLQDLAMCVFCDRCILFTR